MSIALWSLLIAGLLPLLFTGYAKAAGAKASSGYDNNDPRSWLGKQSGAALRAHNAQQNSFEWYPLFVAGILVCQVTGTTGSTVDMLAISYVLLRLLYGICYIADWATVRSLVWLAAISANVALFVVAA